MVEVFRTMSSNQTIAKTDAYLALGSNLGDSVSILKQAIAEIQPLSVSAIQVSSFWKTTPVDCPPDSPPFFNAVVKIQIRAEETAETLLSKLQELEKQFGRQPKQILNESRPLDLDIIVFGEEHRNSSRLILPHPRAHERLFVLMPLAEIAPDLILRGQTSTVRELISKLPPDSAMVRIQ